MAEPCFNRSRTDFIPVARPSVTAAEVSAVVGAMRDVQLSQGPRVAEFESRFAAMHGCAHGASCNSGTSALQLAIEALGLRGKRIACPAMAMVAVPNAIISAGCTPVFVDSEPASGNVDLSQLDSISDSLAAAIVIHLYGVPVEFRASDWKFPILEDAAESHFGSFANGDQIGSRGAAACFSFFANKIITTAAGEGGIVTTNDQALAERVKLLRAHAFTAGEHFHHTEHAHGMRMGELAGAFGCAQLDRIMPMLLHRARLVKAYHHGLVGIEWLDHQCRPMGSANWVMPLMLANTNERFNVQFVREYLAAAGIETRRWFKPMHMQPHLEQFVLPGQEFDVAEDLWERGFYLPLFHDLEVADVERICATLRSI
jgi:perosamine synthetase